MRAASSLNSTATAGVPALRDTDLQEKSLGAPVIGNDWRRGDLLYWKGHVGILTAPGRMVHASGHHMTVVAEPLETVLGRIGPPRSVRRID